MGGRAERAVRPGEAERVGRGRLDVERDVDLGCPSTGGEARRRYGGHVVDLRQPLLEGASGRPGVSGRDERT